MFDQANVIIIRPFIKGHSRAWPAPIGWRSPEYKSRRMVGATESTLYVLFQLTCGLSESEYWLIVAITARISGPGVRDDGFPSVII